MTRITAPGPGAPPFEKEKVLKTPVRFPWSVKLLALTVAVLLGASSLVRAQEATGLELLNTDRYGYEDGETVHMYRVTFESGGRTNWHTHSGPQWLFIVDGRIRAQRYRNGNMPTTT
jgi:hypothetical protein